MTPAKEEQLRAALVDLLKQYEAGATPTHVLIEHLLVALISALQGPTAKAKSWWARWWPR